MFVDLFTLLYADDTIVLAENAEELQLALDALFDYCQLWHLTVNTAKTKIVIFSRGKVRKAPTFLFGGDEICVCDDYIVVGQLKGHFGTIDSENRYMYFWQNKVFAYFCTFNNAERMILTYVYRNTTLHIISNFGGHSLSNIANIKDFQSALSVAQI